MNGPFKLQKWAFNAFKTWSSRGWDLLRFEAWGDSTSENQGQALCQDFALFIKCKNRMLIIKNPRVRKICPQFWGRKWLRQFYGRLQKCALSAGKAHVHKIPPFRGGGILGFGGGGGECRFYFYGREGFSDYNQKILLLSVPQSRVTDSLCGFFAFSLSAPTDWDVVCVELGVAVSKHDR